MGIRDSPYPEAMVRLYDYINSSFDNRMLFGWGPKDMAWVENADGTLSKKADPVLDGYSSYAEVRHTLSMGTKGVTLWSEEDNARFAVTSDRERQFMERQEPYMTYAVEEFIPEGQNNPEDMQEINVLLTEPVSYTQLDVYKRQMESGPILLMWIRGGLIHLCILRRTGFILPAMAGMKTMFPAFTSVRLRYPRGGS